jgi:hypothetical protein
MGASVRSQFYGSGVIRQNGCGEVDRSAEASSTVCFADVRYNMDVLFRGGSTLGQAAPIDQALALSQALVFIGAMAPGLAALVNAPAGHRE